MSDNIVKSEKKNENNTLVAKKAEWQAPSLSKLDVSQTQGGGGVDDEFSDGKFGS